MRKRIPTPLEWQALQRLLALHYEVTCAFANMLGEFLPVMWVDKITAATRIPVRVLLEDIAWKVDYTRYRNLFSQTGDEHAMAKDMILRMLNDKRSTLPEGGVASGEPGSGSHLHMLLADLNGGAMKAAKSA